MGAIISVVSPKQAIKYTKRTNIGKATVIEFLCVTRKNEQLYRRLIPRADIITVIEEPESKEVILVLVRRQFFRRRKKYYVVVQETFEEVRKKILSL